MRSYKSILALLVALAPATMFAADPDRSVALQGASNFRDVGGVQTADGHRVRTGLVFRSDALAHLTDQDLEALRGLKLHMVCDLRSEAERTAAPDRLPEQVEAIVADVTPGSPAMGSPAQDRQAAEMFRALVAQGSDGMVQLYRRFVSTEPALAAYGKLFHRLAERSSLPTLLHCTAGKDRTGWGAAVLQTMLGVPREVVMQDYLASNQHLESLNEAMKNRLPDPSYAEALKPILFNQPAYLDAAFDEVDKRFGSFDAYLHQGLDLNDADIAAIRRSLIEG